MGFVAKAAGGLVGALLGVKKPKAQPTPAAMPIPTRNDAAIAARAEDDIRRRRGGRANNYTGGAEASTAGGAALLGSAT